MDQAIRSAPIDLPWNDLAPSRSMWVSFEYLGMWAKGSDVPAPVASNPNGNPHCQRACPGPAAAIFSSDQRLDADMRSGQRITAGAWLGESIGVEASFFSLQPDDDAFLDSGCAVAC